MSQGRQPPAALPPSVAEDARTYFAAFLGPPAVEAAMQDLAADAAFFEHETREEVLTDAHLVLGQHIDVPEQLAALVLVEDVGLEVDSVASILALPPRQVAARLDQALVEIGEEPSYERVEEPPELVVEAPPPVVEPEVEPRAEPEPVTAPAPARRPQLLRIVRYGLLFLAVVVVSAAVVAALTGPSEPPPSADGCTSDGVCVTGMYFTDIVAAAEGPGEPRGEFTTRDSVWIVVEHRGGQEGSQLELRPTRDGMLLYPEQRYDLDDGAALTVPFAAWFMQEPGTYRVAVVADGLLLAEESFRVVAGEEGG